MGSPARPTSNDLRILHKLLVAPGLHGVDHQGLMMDIHSLRDTAANWHAILGVGLVHLPRLLDHADAKLTSRVYTHLGVDDLRDALKESERDQFALRPA